MGLNLTSIINGTFLLLETEKELKRLGAKEVLLGVRADNKRALLFYEKNGYSFSSDIISLSKQI